MKKSIYSIICLFFGFAAVFGNVAAINIEFCDAYRANVYGYISDILGKLTSSIPICIGEVFMLIFFLLLIIFVLQLFLFIVLKNKTGYRMIFFFYSKMMILLCVISVFVYTYTWSIPFRGSVVKVVGAVDKDYKLGEVVNVRAHIVKKINELSYKVPRDEKGKVIYDNKKSRSELVYSMKKLGEQYPLLKGYYPHMKKAMISDILEWMDIGGYTYPYTMEVTYNKYSTDLYYPFLFAHESSHHQGYYKESEANFLAFLACINSDDVLANYSGYIEIYYYLNDAVLEKVSNNKEMLDYLKTHDLILEQVKVDINDAIKQSEELYNNDNHPAQKLSESAQKASKVGWDVQDEVLKEDNYDGVVKMVLDYYDVNYDLDSGF